MTELIQEYGTDDFVEEWPQSGERLSKAASMRMAENYPQMSGTSPKFTYKRMLGGGDVFVIEGTIDYGDGIPVSYVGDRRDPRRQGRPDDRVLRQPVRGAGLARRLRREDGDRQGLTGVRKAPRAQAAPTIGSRQFASSQQRSRYHGHGGDHEQARARSQPR